MLMTLQCINKLGSEIKLCKRIIHKNSDKAMSPLVSRHRIATDTGGEVFMCECSRILRLQINPEQAVIMISFCKNDFRISFTILYKQYPVSVNH